MLDLAVTAIYKNLPGSVQLRFQCFHGQFYLDHPAPKYFAYPPECSSDCNNSD